MHAHVLLALDRTPVFHRREKAPSAQGLKQDLIESRILRRFDKSDVERAVCVDKKARDRHRLISLLAQIVG